MSQTKILERLVTKFSIKVNDLARYLETSKATVYNYRNLEDFSQIPNDKQYKIFYLFGKENADEMERLIDENDKNILLSYSNRIDSIFKLKGSQLSDDANSVESLQRQIKDLEAKLDYAVKVQSMHEQLEHLDDIARRALFEKIGKITRNLTSADFKAFLDYLDIYAAFVYRSKA